MTPKSPFDKFASDPSHSNELREVLKGKKPPQAESGEVFMSDENEAATGDFSEERTALEAKIKEAEDKAKEEKDRCLRTLAEFENFKKRMEREKSESIQYANEKFIQEMLPLFDSFEMTLTHFNNNEAGPDDEEVTESKVDAKNPNKKDSLVEGVELVFKQLQSTLEKFGVQIIAGEGKPFDPNLQEGIGAVDSPDHASGTVVSVHRKGFKLGNRLIRAALVTVAK